MRSLGILGVLVIVSLPVGVARGQFGLYGAPEVLRLPQTQSDVLPRYADANGAMVSATRVAPSPLAEPTPAESIRPVDRMLRDVGPMDDSAVHSSPCGQMESSTTWEPRGCADTAACDATPCPPPCEMVCECPWYASANWLVMSRNKSNRVWTTYQSGDEPDQLMHTWDMDMEWSHGGEIRFGRRFCCGLWALEAGYWTLSPMHGFASMTNASGVSTPLRVSEIEFDSVNGVDYFDDAAEHRIWRDNEFHNVELNLVRYAIGNSYDPCNPWDIRWIGGVRFFRFAENLRFGSLEGGHNWGDAGGEHEAYLAEKIRNNLIGAQIGCDVKYNFWGNWDFFLGPRIGIYNNHIQHEFQAYRGDGVVAEPTAASHVVGSYPVNSSANFLSFLGEVNVGVNWRVTPNWSAQVGYRAVLATGIGLADHQIPHYIVDIPEIEAINHNGDLLVHGIYAGVGYNF